MRKFIPAWVYIVIVIAGSTNTVFAQRFAGTPPSIKWKSINTDTARIIFPEGLDSQAQRISSLVHYLASQRPIALGDKLYKINIVLQNQTTISNAYVGLGPFRSEMYLNPPPNNFDEGTIPWGDQLAIHEYRHVQQFNNFRTGLSKAMYVLFGQEGFSVAVNASVPDWFFEGDAVYNETILSRQGRGRVPFFTNAYPSLWRAGKNYSWMKLRNGSYKDYVPNHYYLGYLLVNYGREKYGLDFWSKVTTDAAAFKGLIYPFQHAIKKYAGVSYETFRKEAFDYYKKLDNEKQGRNATATSPAKAIFPVNKNVVTNYMFPYVISNDSLLYLKTSYNRRPTFYIKDGEREHALRVKDISIDDQFSYRNGKIVYAAYETDHRWAWRDYSVIKLLDVNTNQETTLGHRKKYFTPDISPSGEKIAAVNVNTNGKSELHILDPTGNVITTLKSTDIALFTDPKFIDDNSLVCVVRLIDGKSALAIADLTSGGIERLTAPSFNVSGYPCVNDGKVYFTASYLGNDDIFALKLSDRKVYKITNGPLGNYFVNASGGKLTWSAFTAEGYQLQQMDEKDIQWTPVSDNDLDKVVTKFPVSHSNEVGDVLLNPSIDRKFAVSKYSKGTGFFNFHSWRPYYEDPEFSFSIYGQNILNTTETELYYLYNQDEKTNAVGANFIYGGLFPYLSIGTQYTFDRQRVAGNKVKQWDQLDSRVGINIPLNWISGQVFNSLNFGSNYVYRNDFNKGIYKDTFVQVNFSYLYHFISWSQQVEMARQHIYPKLGYAVTFNYRHAITNYKSWQPIVVGSIYLPGFMPTHSIVLSGAYQETDTINVLFGSRFPYSRGYNAAYFFRMWKVAANYHFPLIYPDFGIGNILYLYRLRGNLFYDYTRGYFNNLATRDQRSMGAELFVETNWWNQYPLTFGVRVSRLIDRDLFTKAKGTVFEFILPVSIIPR